MQKWVSMACAGVLMLVSATGSGQAQADEAERRHYASLIADQMQLETAFADVTRVIVPLIEPSIRQGFPQASEDQVAEAMTLLENAFDEATPEFVAEMVDIYASLFTLEELQALSSFLETPEGARFAELQPELTRQGQVMGEALGQQIVQRIVPQLNAIMRSEADD